MSVNVFFLLLLLLLALYVCCAGVFDGYVRFLFIWIGDAWMDVRDGERESDGRIEWGSSIAVNVWQKGFAGKHCGELASKRIHPTGGRGGACGGGRTTHT